MSTVRFTTVALTLLALTNAFGGCAAAMPRGAITSDRPCEDDLECNSWETPKCYRNLQQCYNGLCLIRKIAGCRE